MVVFFVVVVVVTHASVTVTMQDKDRIMAATTIMPREVSCLVLFVFMFVFMFMVKCNVCNVLDA